MGEVLFQESWDFTDVGKKVYNFMCVFARTVIKRVFNVSPTLISQIYLRWL